ncbi:hypothetical protein OBB00_07875, partial [Gammaproteobacteria bacterium]|nr:hypothetical protein [Gammaproteobacteria bacterium]
RVGQTGDPFSQYEKWDFDFTDANQISIVPVGCTVSDLMSNELTITAARKNFSLNIKGLNPNIRLRWKSQTS